RGNVHFATPSRRTPRIAEPGLPGQARVLRLELKLIADAGLVGPPNAGKSSLLAALTAAHPKVADYPFTTLDPELGVVTTASGERLVLADIPGLIEGAARGAGLGLRFLRHLERTRALVYVVDGAGADPWGDLSKVRSELGTYSAALPARPSLVVVNKLDLEAARELRARGDREDALFVSALTGDGLDELRARIREVVGAAASPVAASEASLPVRRLRPLRPSAAPPLVTRHPWGFEVGGRALDRLVQRTDFDSEAALERFQVGLDRIGVTAALEAAGARPGDSVRIGEREFEYQP
ncbi:MAG: Obg family GTPase CgtA, partial [Candidatus Dormibacteraceae bacterium]